MNDHWYSNPFSTRFTSVGKIPYDFDEGETPESIVDRFVRDGLRGQIVGPHGCGKSTLMQTLLPYLTKRFRSTFFAFITLHDRQRRLPESFWKHEWRTRLALVDGYEQLGVWERLRLRLHYRSLLLVTHHPVPGLPILCRLRPSTERFYRLVRHLLQNHEDVSEEELRNVFDRNRGNFRDAFFELYDRFENDRSHGLFFTQGLGPGFGLVECADGFDHAMNR